MHDFFQTVNRKREKNLTSKGLALIYQLTKDEMEVDRFEVGEVLLKIQNN